MPDCNPYFGWYNAHQIFTTATPQRSSSGQEVTTETGSGGGWKPPQPPQPAVINKIQIGECLVQGDKNDTPGVVLSDIRRWRATWLTYTMNDKPPGMEIKPSNEQLTALN